jgi:hypothetical protein
MDSIQRHSVVGGSGCSLCHTVRYHAFGCAPQCRRQDVCRDERRARRIKSKNISPAAANPQVRHGSAKIRCDDTELPESMTGDRF